MSLENIHSSLINFGYQPGEIIKGHFHYGNYFTVKNYTVCHYDDQKLIEVYRDGHYYTFTINEAVNEIQKLIN